MNLHNNAVTPFIKRLIRGHWSRVAQQFV